MTAQAAEQPSMISQPSEKSTTMTESAQDRARRLWNGNAESTAVLLLEELKATPEAIDVLIPWVADRVRATMRASTREAEEIVWPDTRDRTATAYRAQTGQLPSLNDIERLLDLPVLVPVEGDGRQSIRWRDMTVKDHQERIGMLRKNINGIEHTISRHEWSIAEIRKYKVRCLGDIPPEALKADL